MMQKQPHPEFELDLFSPFPTMINITWLTPPTDIYIYIYIYILGVIVIIVVNEHGDTSSNPGQGCSSHSTNTHGKGMNPAILLLAMGK